LKSSAALPNHIRMTRKAVNPIIKPNNPTHVEMRWTPGLSKAVDNFGPSLWRREIRVKRRKKMIERPIEVAINAGVVAVGALRRLGALLGRLDRSY